MFDLDGKLAYEVSQRDFNNKKFKETITARHGQNWGKIYISARGEEIRLWGVLDGVQFHYQEFIYFNRLTLTKDGATVEFVDSLDKSIQDHAYVNNRRIDLQKPNFYEGQAPTKPSKELDTPEALHRIFLDYTKILNIKAAKEKAKKLKVVPAEKVRPSLGIFLR